jgi:hypothetical protein
VNVNIDQTANEMAINFDSGRMVTIFPKGSFPSLSPVVVPRRCTHNELYRMGRPRDHLSTAALHKQVYMVGSHHVVQYTKPIPLLCLKQPPYPQPSITAKLEQKLSFVIPVRDMQDVPSWEVLSIPPCHGVRRLSSIRSAPLEWHFRYQK